MKRLRRSLTGIAAALLLGCSAYAADNRWAVSTDLAAWARLCTINASIHHASGAHTSAGCSIEYNPFEFNSGESGTLRIRCFTPQLFLCIWPGSPFDGLYAKGKVLWSVYNIAGIKADSFPEGTLAGVGVGAGYCHRIGDRFALSADIGTTAYHHNTTYYAGAHCGRILDRKKGFGLIPLDCSLSIICFIHR